VRLIALLTSVSLLLGLFIGQFSGKFLAGKFSSFQYVETISGTVYIDTPSQIEVCPPYPNDDPALSSFIITDDKTNGYALGEGEIYEYGLEPSSYKCSYSLNFPIEVSPTGKYSLIFSSGSDFESSLNGDLAFDGSVSDYYDSPQGAKIQPSNVLWFLTTVCSGSQLICLD
jgi:hypothetical protein